MDKELEQEFLMSIPACLKYTSLGETLHKDPKLSASDTVLYELFLTRDLLISTLKDCCWEYNKRVSKFSPILGKQVTQNTDCYCC